MSAGESVLDPHRHLQALDQRILLAHGFHDRLIPYTETLRLHRALPSSLDARMFITRFFAHSKRGALAYLAHPVEVYRFLSLLGIALRPC